jgi:hypothetical protein
MPGFGGLDKDEFALGALSPQCDIPVHEIAVLQKHAVHNAAGRFCGPCRLLWRTLEVRRATATPWDNKTR